MRQRIQDTVLTMLTDDMLYPYAEVLARFILKEYDKKDNNFTIGVTIKDKKIYMLYNSTFINSLSDKELIFVLIHEVFHILLHHHFRQGLNSLTNNIANGLLVNQVQDIIINESIVGSEAYSQQMTFPSGGCRLYDLEKSANKKYDGLFAFEPLWLWMLDNVNMPKNDNENTDYIKVGFDSHINKEISEEDAMELEDVSKELFNSFKERGTLPDKLVRDLEQSLMKKPDYLKIIKKIISSYLLHGSKFKTFTRPHIYNIEGLKGKTYRKYQINVILDTSGSMCDEFKTVLSFLYKNKVVSTLIQIDTEIQSITKITKDSQLKNIKITGLGGTKLQPAIDYITTSKLNTYTNLILTDGYTDNLDLTRLNKNTLILTTGRPCTVKGKCRQIYINNK